MDAWRARKEADTAGERIAAEDKAMEQEAEQEASAVEAMAALEGTREV